jgi:aspartyl-tRNA(Asn)/glutamyl-tRNA(Gln) amidotransferase subunit B
MYVGDSVIGGFFDAVCALIGSDKEVIRLASNYISTDLAALVKAGDGTLGQVSATHFVELVAMTKKGDLSSRGAKDILALMYAEGGDPLQIATEKGLLQKSDAGALEAIVKDIIKANDKVVQEFKAGKEASLQFLVGQGMKASKGSANPKLLAETFRKLIS